MGPYVPSSSDTDKGRPERSTSRRSSANVASGLSKSVMSCIAPLPHSRRPAASACNSVSAAWKLGVDLPSLERWKNVREVEKPIAPACIACTTNLFIKSMGTEAS